MGGTGVEQWASPSALEQCAGLWPQDPTPNRNAKAGCHGTACAGMTLGVCESPNTTQQWERAGPWCSGLWAQMMTPLLPLSLRAVLFYQGENNNCVKEADGNFHNDSSSCPPPVGGRFYACQFPALIRSWRSAFNPPEVASADEAPLPFLFAELDGFAASNFAVIRAAQMATATQDPHSRIIVNHDLGTLNDPGGKIHSPRKEELGRRFALHAAQLVYGATAGSAPARGPALASASATATEITARFQAGDRGTDRLYLHGTAGCIGPNETSPCCGPGAVPRACCNPKAKSPCTDKQCTHPRVGIRCCDTNPFSIGWATDAGTQLTWIRAAPNTSQVDGLTVVLSLPKPPLPGAKPRGLRLNWEAYPNCAVYDAPGGPAAGAWNVKGAVAKGCKGYAECVYEGSALPALPAQIEVT